MILGTYTVSASTGQLVVVDADFLFDATDGDILLIDGSAGDVAVAASAAFLTNASVGSAGVVVAAASTTAVFTAGAGRFRIEYRS